MSLHVKLFALLSATFVIGTVANAADTKAPGSKLVCKSEAKTGTRFPKKTCMTKAEWDAATEQSRKDASELIDKQLTDLRRLPQ